MPQRPIAALWLVPFVLGFAGDPPEAPGEATCPGDMVAVEGEYCTEVRQHCASWMEPPGIANDGRCAHFDPSECVGERKPMRFCIDRDEYTPAGQTLPEGTHSWGDARKVCSAAGKRLCLESEWNFACEGEQMLPYPTGLDRPSTLCNFDQHHLLDHFGKPLDLRKPSSSLVGCVSPFGVRNMVGNIDEWVVRDVSPGPHRSALKGGWWLAGRNRCRPATTAHDEVYRDFQTGLRCCR
jgi:formylglycine-generating enzyme